MSRIGAASRGKTSVKTRRFGFESTPIINSEKQPGYEPWLSVSRRKSLPVSPRYLAYGGYPRAEVMVRRLSLLALVLLAGGTSQAFAKGIFVVEKLEVLEKAPKKGNPLPIADAQRRQAKEFRGEIVPLVKATVCDGLLINLFQNTPPASLPQTKTQRLEKTLEQVASATPTAVAPSFCCFLLQGRFFEAILNSSFPVVYSRCSFLGEIPKKTLLFGHHVRSIRSVNKEIKNHVFETLT